MESSPSQPNDLTFDLLKYGSLFSNKLRELKNSLKDELGEEEGDLSINNTNYNVDSDPDENVNLNLDLNNFLNEKSNEDDNEKNFNLLNKKNKLNKQDLEKNWSNIKEKEITPELLREWKAIQLRSFINPKRFYKNSKIMEKMPNKFHIGFIISNNSNSSKKNRKSLINSMLNEDQRFIDRRYAQIQSEKTRGSKGWYQRQKSKRSKK